MRKFRDIYEKIIVGVLFSSSTITSLTVILIIVFLFKEGIGLFNHAVVDDNHIIAISSQNPVKDLTADKLAKIFNQDYATWQELGGTKDSVKILTTSTLMSIYSEEQLGANGENIPSKVNEYVKAHPGAILFMSKSFLPADFAGREIAVDKISLKKFLTGTHWYPTSSPIPQFGIWAIIMGTLMVTLGAILFAIPLGMATAIYLSEIASMRLRNIVKPIVELLAGIPSVVYGFFGLIVVVPLIQKGFNLDVGETILAGSIILGIMALPTIITVAEDALRTTPRALKEASLALGASEWQTLRKVVIPYAKSGISTAIILGIGRAIGETMAVLMVTGNSSNIPTSFLQPARTIPATIAAELGEAPYGGLHFKALFALAVILFLFTIIINLTVEVIKNKARKQSA